MTIQEWLDTNQFQYQWIVEQRIFIIGEDKFVIIQPKKEKIFNEQFELLVSEKEQLLLETEQCKYYVFEFGEYWFYSKVNSPVKLDLFRYVGQSTQTSIPYLGVHGGYELCNGSREYEDWCKKAKFLQISALGICEKNTLAGVLKFQKACKSVGLQSIIGETVLVKKSDTHTYQVKLFVKDEVGWNNLLWINKAINVDNSEKFVAEDYLLERLDGLICVLGSETKLSEEFIDKYKAKSVFYQIDPVVWKSNEKDRRCLEAISKFYHDYFAFISPVIICDSYYLDKSDASVKEFLNKIGKITQENQSEDQYFKSIQDIEQEIERWFGDKKDAYSRFMTANKASLSYICDQCKFEINTKQLHLPIYELSEEEKKKYTDTDDLFWSLIEDGMERKVIAKGFDADRYYDRIAEEVDVLKEGGIIDYFLILHDIIAWCKTQGILTGIGRGSAAGSLIAWLLDLVKINPLDYDLLFERFLNRGRVKVSLPDIDTDLPGNRRDDVKRYVEQRYGVDNVCSIGTYGTFKVRVAFKDVCRIEGIPPGKVNYYAAMIEENGWEYSDLFKEVLSRDIFKEFIHEIYTGINQLPLFLGQSRTNSIHAAGVVITPKEGGMSIYDWMPVKKMDGVLVSEWEGPELESAGFLKEDLLGIRQLDKIDAIFKLIKENGKQVPDLDNIDTKDEMVFELFKMGYNQDLFHFGSLGLTQYSQQLKPDNIEELIAMIAAYRPGAMEFNAHRDLVSIKFGRKEPEYDFGTREILETTYGLYLYQEQVMKIFQVLGDLSLEEADNVRRAIGKKDLAKMQSYKDGFLKSIIAKGCQPYEANKIWDKLEAFASYSFNKSHAASYALTGYFCQWLKLHHSIEFWTVALQYADDDEIPERINELSRIGNIKITPPDINNSQLVFSSDMKSNTIYWSINKISRVGDVAVQSIISEREKRGKFFSLNEFLSRIEKRKVNKACVTNLILAGAFDQVEGIQDIRERKTLLVKYYQSLKQEMPVEYLVQDSSKEWFWYLQQKNVSGSGIFDHTKLFSLIKINDNVEQLYCPPERVMLEDNVNCNAVVIGVLKEVIEKKSRKGEFGHLIIDHNNAPIEITLWNESWKIYGEEILKSEGRMITVGGKIQFDRWRNKNVIHSQEDTKVQIL